MAAQAKKASGPKPSFASIAAMAPPTSNGLPLGAVEHERPSEDFQPSSAPSKKPKKADSPVNRDLQKSMSRLNVRGPATVSDALNEHAQTNIKRAGLSLDDDQTHVSSSSTKAPSLDGKSTTSGTTFALDEKESLRPDDSASVKAAEDEDFGSGAPNSIVGSEPEGRAFRDQFNEISERIATGPQPSQAPDQQPLEAEDKGPQILRSPLVPILPPSLHITNLDITTVPPPLIDVANREPDEKLFEALASPKDRMFLLRLEQDIITFVRDSTDVKIDLPPCNSFCRLLAHKLADYYALTHFVDNAVSSVTLYRTPYCRIPTPLSSLANTHMTGSSGGSTAAQPAMKIMRRPGLGKDSPNPNSGAATTASSVEASKAGSEVGDENQRGTGAASPTDSNVAKDKAAMSRAEREARYKEKREELFGPQIESVDSSEAVQEVSRTSSRNEDKKKRKKPKNDDDGFEARSQFNAYYPALHFSPHIHDQGANPAPFYGPYAPPSGSVAQHGNLGSSISQTSYQQGYPAISTAQAYLPGLSSNSLMNTYGGHVTMPTFDPQNPTQYYSLTQQRVPIDQHSSPTSSPPFSANAPMSRSPRQPPDQQWPSNNFVYPLQQSSDHQQQYLPPIIPSVPYPYGQLPYQPGTSANKAVHPLPGSFSRQQQQFNPQTRAFIPGTGPPPLPAPPSYANSPIHSTRNPTNPQLNGQQFGICSHQSSQQSHMHPMSTHGAYSLSQEPKSQSGRKASSQFMVPKSNESTVQSSLSKWGIPANLPPKPPPPEPSVPENLHSLPLNNQFNVNIQPLNGGRPMPNYNNGVYSMPGLGPQG